MKRNTYKMKSNPGFTLIELVVVLGILGILIAITAVSIGKYTETTYAMKVNQTAKTIFFAAQNQLTEVKAGKDLEALNLASQKVDLQALGLADTTEERKDNENHIRSLMLSKNGGTSNGELRKLLTPLVGDKEILNQTVLVEYNAITGVVRSVFYSEKADYFTYDGDTNDVKNVIVRDTAALRAKKQGYYGVDYTGKVNELSSYPAPKVKIVNGERLTVEWTDPYAAVDGAEYDVTIKSADGKETYLKIEGIYKSVTSPLVAATLEEADKSSIVIVPKFDTVLHGSTSSALISHRMAYVSSDYPFKLILDSLDNSIFTNYKNIKLGNIKAEVSARVTDQAPKKAVSNTEHSYFSFSKPGFLLIQPYCGISYPRHLNNIRYAVEGTNYRQTQDIVWNSASYTFGTLKFSYRRDWKNPDAVTSKEAYAGSYNGQSHKISGLSITGTDKVGLFSHCGSGSVLQNLTLTGMTVGGSGENIGAVTGINEGTLLSCTVGASAGDTSTVAGTNNVGGLAGKNDSGTVLSSANYASVTGRNYVGGLVGHNSINLSGLTNYGNVSGERFVGGISGENQSGKTVESCINRGRIHAVSSASAEYIGGIVGQNLGTVTSCQNILDAMTSSAALSKAQSYLSDTTAIAYSGKYVGGIAGNNKGTIKNVLVKNEINGKDYVGGIVGCNAAGGQILHTEASTSADVQGIVAASGDFAGGIAGANLNSTSMDISGYINEAYVFGKRYVGGILGSNGASLNASGVMETTGTDSKIINSINRGFVYGIQAYTGGISGYNVGLIKNCKNDYAATSLSVCAAGAACDYVGGIAGYNNGTIEGDAGAPILSKNIVVGRHYVGGVVGKNDVNAQIHYCQTSGGKVLASGNFVGGLVGLNSSPQLITNITVLTNEAEEVSGKYFVGGIFGGNVAKDSASTVIIQANNGKVADSSDTVLVQNKYNVIGEAFVGGIIGGNLAAIPDESQIDPYSETPVPDSAAVGKLEIRNSANLGTVLATRYVGGIIGYNYTNSTLRVTGSKNNGVVTARESSSVTDGYYYIGGITGRNSPSGVLETCYNNGVVNSPSLYSGGLVEVNEGLIQTCGNRGSIYAKNTLGTWLDNAGGIAGLNRTKAGSPAGRILDCNSTGKVRGKNNIGGLVGENQAIVQNGTLSGADGGASGEENVGGFVGLNTGDGSIVNCNSTGGTVSGTIYIGGIVGYNKTTKVLDNLINGASVYGTTGIGGIVGGNDGTQIQNCTNKGTVQCTASNGLAGGITSANASGKTISGCMNTGKVTRASGISEGDTTMSGGITATNEGILENCTNKGAVLGAKNAGGIAARNLPNGKIIGCTVSGSDEVSVLTENAGGVVGLNEGTLTDCVNTGITVKGLNYIGGLVGLNSGTGSLTYTDPLLQVVSGTVAGTAKSSASGTHEIGGVIGRNQSTAMKTLTGYTNKATVYFVHENSNNYAGGITAINRASYIVDRCDNQGIVGSLTAAAWSTNAYSQGTGGIVGQNQTGAVVQNIALTGGTVYGINRVGGIIGDNQGAMTQCVNHSDTVVTGRGSYTGGYIGYDLNSAIFTYTRSAPLINYAQVSGNSRTGGIVGSTASPLAYCDNRGSVIGTDGNYIGGIVGETTANITDCINMAGGTVNSHSQYTGGIVGLASGDIMMNCENLGSVTATNSYAGGIAGRVTGGTRLEGCQNSGTVKGTTYTGGIVGRLANINAAGTITVNKCINAGEVSSVGDAAGGIIGGIARESNSSAVVFSVTECRNEAAATVSANRYSGGIIGNAANISNATLNLTNCLNYGTLTVLTDTAGGIAGSWTMPGTLLACENYGILTAGSNLGGIVGTLSGNSAVRTCVNYADIGTDAKVSSSQNIGGIVGNSSANIYKCENRGNIRRYTTGSVRSNVGGIAGLVQNAGLVQYSTNYGAVITDADNVGGIAGSLSGVVMSCHAEVASGTASFPVDGNIYHITGRNYVGGVVGNASENTALLYSGLAEGSAIVHDLDISSNRMNVTGVQYIGGVAGRLQAGSVLTTCNLGRVYAQNPGSGTAGEAGGIVGGTQNTRPSITNCYNLGEISQKYFYQTNSLPHIGGIVGRRDASNPAHIKASYYISGLVNNVSQELSIGNEADTLAGTIREQDTPADDPKRVLTNSMVAEYGVGDLATANIAEVMTAVEKIMEKYVYTLDSTGGVKMTSKQEYAYDLSWNPVQGYVAGYEVWIYDGFMQDADKNFIAPDDFDPKSTAHRSVSVFGDLSLDGRNRTSVSYTFKPEDVGHIFAIAVISKGRKDSSGKPYSYDSVPTVVGYCKVLPVLPAPEITAEVVIGAQYKAIITNTAKYTDEGPADYTTYAWTDVRYASYKNGLDQFSGKDEASASENTGYSQFSDVLLTDLTKVPYAKLLTDYGANPNAYHRITLRAMDSTDKIYANSAEGVYKFKVLIKLNPSTLSTPVYTGDTVNPSFDIGYSHVPNNKGYTMEILDGETVIARANLLTSSQDGKYSFKDQDFVNAGETIQNYIGKTLSVRIQTLGTEPYITSNFSEKTDFMVPYKLDAPQLQYTVSDTDDKSYKIHWTMPDGADVSTYNVKVFKADGTTTYFSAVNLTKAEYAITFLEADFGATYPIHAVAVGVTGESLNSDPGTIPLVLSARLPMITEPKSVLLSHEKPEYKLTWNIPTGITADNCRGYKILFVQQTGNALRDTVMLDGFDNREITYIFDEAYLNQVFDVRIIALGKGGAAANSDYPSFTLRVARKLLPPQNVTLTSGFPDNNTVPFQDYTNYSHTLSWTNPAEPAEAIGGTKLSLYADGIEMTDVYALDGGLINAGVSQYTFKIPPKYAGQTITAKVRTISTSELHSAFVDAQPWKLPAAILPAPQITSFDYTPADKTAESFASPQIAWSDIHAAAVYAEKYRLTVDYRNQALTSIYMDTKDVPANQSFYSYNAEAEKLADTYSYTAALQMLGDGAHYISSAVSTPTATLFLPHKLSTPVVSSQTVNFDTLRASWAAVENASNYRVAVTYLGADDSILEEALLESNLAATEVVLPLDRTKYPTAKTVVFKVHANGDGTHFITSGEGVTTDLVPVKLIVSGLSLAGNSLGWDTVPGASGYRVEVTYLDEAKAALNVVSADILDEATAYPLAEYTGAKYVHFTVTALGDVIPDTYYNSDGVTSEDFAIFEPVVPIPDGTGAIGMGVMNITLLVAAILYKKFLR